MCKRRWASTLSSKLSIVEPPSLTVMTSRAPSPMSQGQCRVCEFGALVVVQGFVSMRAPTKINQKNNLKTWK
ncbi:hypothetical protein GOP47_0003036 [Adiantum capillus-veneris]|uniref:Uncharacterized protein n=1 Tax=Adiantum capillus-veneris TaxID=13818 RepID=A0A9D4VBP1_ADICA|nr:hypothetical protein GOP47_0003036 [Adiantum capillus-veneris]